MAKKRVKFQYMGFLIVKPSVLVSRGPPRHYLRGRCRPKLGPEDFSDASGTPRQTEDSRGEAKEAHGTPPRGSNESRVRSDDPSFGTMGPVPAPLDMIYQEEPKAMKEGWLFRF